MCTTCWYRLPGNGFILGFNRDEQRSRPRSQRPEICSWGNGISAAFSRDPMGGGTWLAANSNGLVTGLLNYYQAGGGFSGLRSRGEIITLLSMESNFESAVSRLKSLNKENYGPFELFIIQGNSSCFYRCAENRFSCAGDFPEFHSSSSFAPEKVIPSRINRYLRLKEKMELVSEESVGEVLSDKEGEPPYRICMDREDACTVSQTVIKVKGGQVSYSFRYRSSHGYGFSDPQSHFFNFDKV